MKKAAAILLTLVLCGTMLTACGNDNSSTTDPSNSPSQTTTPGENMMDDAENMVEDITQGAGEAIKGVADGMAGILMGVGDEAQSLTDVEESMWKDDYGIDANKYEEVAVKAAPDGSEAREIILIRAKDEANLQEAVTDLENRKKQLEEKWKGDETQLKRVQSAVVKTKGDYAVLIVAENAAEAEKAFDSLSM
ncbi:MAG: DUF4358 domain-containing protein [Eubacteriales bacterium]|jgi:hypothetical protein